MSSVCAGHVLALMIYLLRLKFLISTNAVSFSQIAGTVDGIKEPTTTFSACFGAAFIMLHPTKYAAMLADKMKRHGATAWLVNTGWSGGR